MKIKAATIACAWLGLCLLTAISAEGPRPERRTPVPAATLAWWGESNRVDAAVDGVPLKDFLPRLARATGWQIYVEPETQRTVSARFSQLNTTEALRRLMGSLSYALLPRTNASPALFIYETSIARATEAVDPSTGLTPGGPKSPRRLDDELIVTLKPGSKLKAEELAAQLGARLLGTLEDGRTLRLKFDSAEAARAARLQLADNGDVASIDANYAFGAPNQPELIASGALPPIPIKAKPVGDGNRIVVALVDTPVQTEGINFKDFLLSGLKLQGDTTASSGELSHGTSIAETIIRGLASTQGAGAESSVRLLPVDVYGGSEQTTTFDVARGIYAAAKAGANIINLSLGSESNSPFLQRAIEELHSQGVLFVAAAGNTPVTTPTYPAAYPEVIATTAGDRYGRVASYANRGDFVDVIAPGSSVIHFENQSFLGTGTSYSTAYVAGAVAAYAEKSGKSAADVEKEIRQRLALSPGTSAPLQP